MSLSAIHQPEQQRFIVQLASEQASLNYRLDNTTQSVNFYSTWVPDSARGLGLAKLLVEQGLAWARQQQLTIQADCWYVEKFLTHSA